MTDLPRATIYSVAERANVSIATVSRTLSGTDRVSERSRQRVLEAIRELNYIPDGAARSLAVKRHRALGLVLPELTGFYYPELLTGFESVAAEQRQSVVLLVAGFNAIHNRSIQDLLARVDGLAVMNGAGIFGTERLAMIDSRLPIVQIGAGPWHGDVVSTASFDSARAITHHVIEHGRTRLVFAGDPKLATDAAYRWQGFCAALDEAGLASPTIELGGFDAVDGHALGRRIADGELSCDAVVCVNDQVALGLCLELRRRGVVVPDDIAVTGWDDEPATRYTTPGITTVVQPVRDLGRAAAARLLARLQVAASPEGRAELPTQLVLRGSCGCDEDPPGASASGGRRKEDR